MSRRQVIGSAAAAVIVSWAAWAGMAQVQEKKAEKKPPAAAKKQAVEAPAKDKAASPPAAKPAAEQKKAVPEPSKPAAVAVDPEEAELRQSAEAFVTAYNAHDAKGLSELFAEKAEFIDEGGNLIKGREAIAQDFARMFQENPECRIEVEPDSIRVLTPNIAVEEGLVRGQPSPDGPQNVSTYLAVHVKLDGKWQVASVRDFEAAPEDMSASDNLESLAWMVGDWIDESPDSVVKTHCEWDASGNYLLHEFVVQIAGGVAHSGSMRIGWDPLTAQLKSWTFDADSAYSEGLWSLIGDEWIVKSRGVTSDGAVTTATHVFRYVDKDTMTWRSYDRITGGETTDDVQEYVIKRQAPPPEE